MYLLHGIEYFVLAFILVLYFEEIKFNWPYVGSIVLCIIIAYSLELLQKLTTYRTYNILDFLAGTIGALIILFRK